MNETYDVSAFRAVFERSFTWISGFLRNVRRFGEKTAVIDLASGRTWTYAALNRDANRLANALQAAGRYTDNSAADDADGAVDADFSDSHEEKR